MYLKVFRSVHSSNVRFNEGLMTSSLGWVLNLHWTEGRKQKSHVMKLVNIDLSRYLLWVFWENVWVKQSKQNRHWDWLGCSEIKTPVMWLHTRHKDCRHTERDMTVMRSDHIQGNWVSNVCVSLQDEALHDTNVPSGCQLSLLQQGLQTRRRVLQWECLRQQPVRWLRIW